MRKPKEPRRLAWPAAALAAATALAGCSKAVVLNPAGDVAAQQGQLVITATLLMLVIIVPVIALTLFFAWKYRQGNTEAEYDPEWHHSTKLELVIWSVPLAIIIILGALMQIGSGSAWVVILGALAVLMASVNIFGGFMVTRRMLAMFQKS